MSYDRNKVINILKFLLPIIFTFLFTMALPLIAYADFVSISEEGDVNIDDYLQKAQFVIALSVIIGGVITGLTIFQYLEEAHSFRRFFISIAILIIYCVYLYIWSVMCSIKISIGYITFWIDLSLLYTFFAIVPILLVGKRVYDFIIIRREFQYKIYILKVLWDNKKINSKSQIVKNISKNYYISDKKRNYLLKNLSNIMRELEICKKPLIHRSKGYRLTQRGIKLLNNSNLKPIRKVEYLDTINPREIELEYWTEEQLEDLKRKRIKFSESI